MARRRATWDGDGVHRGAGARMTANAYEIREERPKAVEIDLRASEAALRHGQELAKAAGCDPAKLREVIWALMVDAARTERAFARPGPTGFASGWPDCWQTPGEIVGAYNDRNSERRAAETAKIQFDDDLYRGSERAEAPRAAEVSRYEAVTTWLRFCHGFEKRRVIRIVWWRAHGRPYPWISRQDGQPVRRVREIRAEQLEKIEAGIKKRLGL